MKYYRIFFFLLLGLFVYGMNSLDYLQVFAQETSEQIATRYHGIRFPIVELGNCTNVATCKVFCNQPENRDACTTFAKTKGLSNGKRKVNEKQVAILARAQTELGCQTIPACQTFCEQPQNITKCQAFANRHGLSTPLPPSEISDEELLKAAKQKLGCESYDSCQRLCDEERNYTKCAALMQSQVTSDERAMFEKYKPLIKEYLDCDSIVTCMAFCINPLNTKRCQELAERIEEEQGGTPNTESPDPEVWCPKVSSECSWDGTNCVCMGPQTCAQSNDIPGCTWDGTQCNCPGIAEEPGEVWCPKAGPNCSWDGSSCTCWDPQACDKEGCTWTGKSCECSGVGPEVWCPRSGEGCTWDGNMCSCPGNPVQTSGQGYQQEPPEIWCPKLGPYCVWDGSSCTCWDECVKSGGKWTGQTCEYQGGTNQPPIESNIEPPEVSCIRNPDCKWTGETCLCTPVQAPQTEPTPTVQGAATSANLLEQIIQFFLSL